MIRLSRRQAIKRAVQVSVATGLPFSFSASGADMVATWPDLSPTPVTATGYGTDPDLIHPAPLPWPLTLTKPQKAALHALANILIPAEGDVPSAGDVGVVEVVDEWVSAPYPEQQQHRQLLLAGLAWLDTQVQEQYGPAPRQTFATLNVENQTALVDTIAYPERIANPQLAMPARFFALVRQLVVGAFYTSPEGVADLGYIGNVPIAGDYPGPTPEAQAHLARQLKKLGLNPV